MNKIQEQEHPKALDPVILGVNIVLSLFGAIIGLQIITTLGTTPNTSIIGVLVAIIISRIPIGAFLKFRNIHRQNLVQTAISSATFGAANSLLLPIAIPFLLGRVDLIWPMMFGAAIGMTVDMLMLFWMFDSKSFPGKAAWPAGVAAAEAIKAGDAGGKRAWLLGYGIIAGAIGSFFKIPMSALGITMIANIWSMLMFATGLLLRGYSGQIFGVDINKLYIPHGFMIGAGLVAGIQIVMMMKKRKNNKGNALAIESEDNENYTRSEDSVKKSLTRGFALYVIGGIILAILSGLYTQMSVGVLVVWVFYAALACVLAEFIVGLSAMHSGWFPAFATSLIFLVIGVLLGFPPIALAMLVGFIASGGPAFADAGFDFKCGWLLRGMGKNPVMELEGRRQQLISAFIGLGVGMVAVAFTHTMYFENGLFPPVAKVFAATIQAGVDPTIINSLLIWAIPGAIVQALGGAKRQMGVMMSTGLLIFNPKAGFVIIVGLILRKLIIRFKGNDAMISTTIIAAGCIAGDALYGFCNSVIKASAKWRG